MAAKAILPNATKKGETSSIAISMAKKELPQIAESIISCK